MVKRGIRGFVILIDSWIVITAPMKSEMMKTIQREPTPTTVHLSDDGAEEHPPAHGQREDASHELRILAYLGEGLKFHLVSIGGRGLT